MITCVCVVLSIAQVKGTDDNEDFKVAVPSLAALSLITRICYATFVLFIAVKTTLILYTATKPLFNQLAISS